MISSGHEETHKKGLRESLKSSLCQQRCCCAVCTKDQSAGKCHHMNPNLHRPGLDHLASWRASSTTMVVSLGEDRV